MSKKQLRLHEYLSNVMDISGKTQNEIAADCNFNNSNIVSMIKQGKTKLPMAKVIPMAKSLNLDPIHLFRMALKEYQPDTYTALDAVIGAIIISRNELEILEVIRDANPTDPRLNTEQEKEALRKFAVKLQPDKKAITSIKKANV